VSVTAAATAAPPSVARALAAEFGTRRRRVRLDDVWRAFLTVAPEYATSPDRRQALAACLEELETLGLAELPRSAGALDRSERPALPRHVFDSRTEAHVGRSGVRAPV